MIEHPIDWILTSEPKTLGQLLSAWTALAALSAALALFWLARRPGRAIAPECGRCGYPIAGGAADTCSECGAHLAQPRAVRTRRGQEPRRVRGLIALLTAIVLVSAQWWFASGWLLFGERAQVLADAWQQWLLDPSADRIAPEVFVTRAMEEARGRPATVRFARAEGFASSSRLAALGKMIDDPAHRANAFAVALAIQNKYRLYGDLIEPLMSDDQHATVLALIADAVVLDPALVGARRRDGDETLEIEALRDAAPRAAYQWSHAPGVIDEDLTESRCELDLPASAAVAGVECAAIRLEGTVTKPDGSHAQRTIRFECGGSVLLGNPPAASAWFVVAPLGGPGPWSVAIRGEVEYRFRSQRLRDERGEPRSVAMRQQIDLVVDRIEQRRLLP